MPYIGTQPLTGQFKKLDAITVVNNQAAYTLNYNSAAYKPATANALLVSVNGVIQAAGDAFTISGSTITFTENLVTGDVIDFIIALGDTGSAVTPVDGSVTTAKIATDAVTSDKLAHDLTIQTSLSVPTIKDGSGSNTAMTIDSSGRILTPARPAWAATRSSPGATLTTSSAYETLPWNSASINDGNFNTSTYTYTTPVAGLYHINYNFRLDNAQAGAYVVANLAFDGTASTEAYIIFDNGQYHSFVFSGIFELAAGVAITNITYVDNDTSWLFAAYGQFSGYLVG